MYLKKIFILAFLIVFYSCKSEISNKASINVSKEVTCELISQFLDDFKSDENYSQIFLNNQFVKWNESLYFDFKLNGLPWLPKSEQERKERLLSSELIDPYPILFLFAFPITDSMFSNSDRTYMRTQIIEDSVEYFSCPDIRVIRLASENEGNFVNSIAITKPLFSKDNKSAAFVVYSNYSYTNGIIHGVVQNFYYIKTNMGWKVKFSTKKWIL